MEDNIPTPRLQTYCSRRKRKQDPRNKDRIPIMFKETRTKSLKELEGLLNHVSWFSFTIRGSTLPKQPFALIRQLLMKQFGLRR